MELDEVFIISSLLIVDEESEIRRRERKWVHNIYSKWQYFEEYPNRFFRYLVMTMAPNKNPPNLTYFKVFSPAFKINMEKIN